MKRRAISIEDVGGIDQLNVYGNILPPLTLEVLELHYRHNLPLKEICSKINKSMTVVRNHHNRGVYQIKKAVDSSDS